MTVAVAVRVVDPASGRGVPDTEVLQYRYLEGGGIDRVRRRTTNAKGVATFKATFAREYTFPLISRLMPKYDFALATGSADHLIDFQKLGDDSSFVTLSLWPKPDPESPQPGRDEISSYLRRYGDPPVPKPPTARSCPERMEHLKRTSVLVYVGRVTERRERGGHAHRGFARSRETLMIRPESLERCKTDHPLCQSDPARHLFGYTHMQRRTAVEVGDRVRVYEGKGPRGRTRLIDIHAVEHVVDPDLPCEE